MLRIPSIIEVLPIGASPHSSLRPVKKLVSVYFTYHGTVSITNTKARREERGAKEVVQDISRKMYKSNVDFQDFHLHDAT